MNVDRRAVDRWLHGRFQLSLLLLFVPVACTGALVGTYLVTPDDGDLWYLATVATLSAIDILATLSVVETIGERYFRWRRWVEYMQSDLHSQTAKKFAREIMDEYVLAHEPPREADA